MARISEGELERLKREVAVERLVEAAGSELKRAGKDLVGRCPFHPDDTASLVVTAAMSLWHCFGCGVGGGPIDCVMKKRGVSVSPRGGAVARGQRTVRMLAAPVAFDADDAALLNQVADYYHATLKQSPGALAYLEARGVAGAAAAEAIDAFKLGYANRTLGLRLSKRTLIACRRRRLRRSPRLQRRRVLRLRQPPRSTGARPRARAGSR